MAGERCRIALRKIEPGAEFYTIVDREFDVATDRHRNLLIARGNPMSWPPLLVGDINAVAVCALYRDEYPSEWAALDEVPKCLCSTFKRKCLGDDRLDLARLEKPCKRRPRFCQNRCRLSE